MKYSDFLSDSFKALREQTPKATDPEQLEAWLREVGALLAGLPVGLQWHWIDMYATVLVIENGGMLPNLAIFTVRQAVEQAQQHTHWS